MPFKNQAPFIEVTLRSVQSQQDADFEVHMVNDGSTDGSAEIAATTIVGDGRFHIHDGNGGGILSALAQAESMATGEFITRMDADDLMPPGRLKLQRELLQRHGPGHVATGLVDCFSDTESGPGFVRYVEWLNSLCRDNRHQEQLYKECVIASSNWMLFRKDFMATGGYAAGRYPEDYDLVFRMMARGYQIVWTDNITLRWRDHPGRASRTEEVYSDQKFYDLKLDYFLQDRGPKQLALWGAGPSGKALARQLIDRNQVFQWVAESPRKLGQLIYGVEIEAPSALKAGSDICVLVAVTQRDSLLSISTRLDDLGLSWFEL